MKLKVRYSEDEEYPVASLDKDLYGSLWNFIEISPEEFYTAEIYENLRDLAQEYFFSFSDRRA